MTDTVCGENAKLWIVTAEVVGAGEGLGTGEGLGIGVGLGCGEGLGTGEGLGIGAGLGCGDGLGEGDALDGGGAFDAGGLLFAGDGSLVGGVGSGDVTGLGLESCAPWEGLTADAGDDCEFGEWEAVGLPAQAARSTNAMPATEAVRVGAGTTVNTDSGYV